MAFRCVLLVGLAFVALLSPGRAWGDRVLLEYRAAAYGLPSGRLQLDLTVDATEAQADLALRSGGVLDLFAPTALAAHAQAQRTPAGLRQQRFSLDHVYARKRRITFLERSGAELRILVTPRHGSAGDPAPSPAQIETALDPLNTLSAMLLAVGAERRCAGSFPVFDGKRLYGLHLEPVRGDPWTRWSGPSPARAAEPTPQAALRCALRYQPIAGYDPEDQRRKPPRRSEIWFVFFKGMHTPLPVRARLPLPLGAHAEIDLVRASLAEVAVEARDQ